MRNLLLFISAIVLFSCQKETNLQNQESLQNTNTNELIGKWKLVEHFYSIGDENLHSSIVEEGYTFEFRNDGNFISDKIDSCQGGTFEIQEEKLFLKFDCELENNDFIESYFFQDNFLFLIPLSPTVCIEGCQFKFKKIE